MGPQVRAGAALMCSFGLAPSVLAVLPVHKVRAKPQAENVGDVAPVLTVPSFGACTSLANPMVAAATAAALGVLVPMPCVPVPAGPWVPGSPKIMLAEVLALDAGSRLLCAWGGVVQVLFPSQVVVVDG